MSGMGVLLKSFVNTDISKLDLIPTKSKITVLGLLSSLKEIITKKGTRMAFATLEDTAASLELVIFPDVFAANEILLKSD